MFGMMQITGLVVIVGAGAYSYHKVVINEKDNRINQQQMEISSAAQQNVALQTAAATNESTIVRMEKQMKEQA